jgi:hypothetical protein
VISFNVDNQASDPPTIDRKQSLRKRRLNHQLTVSHVDGLLTRCTLLIQVDHLGSQSRLRCEAAKPNAPWLDCCAADRTICTAAIRSAVQDHVARATDANNACRGSTSSKTYQHRNAIAVCSYSMSGGKFLRPDKHIWNRALAPRID